MANALIIHTITIQSSAFALNTTDVITSISNPYIIPSIIVHINMLALLNWRVSGAIKPLNAKGELNIIPIITPFIDQCTTEIQLIPMANPITVRLVIS